MFKTYIATTNGVLKVSAQVEVVGDPLNGGRFEVSQVKVLTLLGDQIHPIGKLKDFVTKELTAGIQMAYDVNKQIA